MKSKLNPAAVLLVITGTLLIAGIFFMGIQARQQIHVTNQSLDTFISQVEDKQQELNNAQTAFENTVKEKADLLNYRQKKAAGSQPVTQEHRETTDSTDSNVAASVFSQDHD